MKASLKNLFADDPMMLEVLERKFPAYIPKDGVDGEPGPQGIQGDKGEKGDKGEPGRDGKDGVDGLNGKDGRDGKDGKDGINGRDGKDGTDGIAPELELIIDSLIKKLIKEKPLDISHIRNANTFLRDGIRYKIEELMHGAGSGGGTVPLAYDISDQFDGVTTTFTLPAYTSILQFTITGWPPEGVLRPLVDFTTPSATSVQLQAPLTAPVAGTTGIILYVPA